MSICNENWALAKTAIRLGKNILVPKCQESYEPRYREIKLRHSKIYDRQLSRPRGECAVCDNGEQITDYWQADRKYEISSISGSNPMRQHPANMNRKEIIRYLFEIPRRHPALFSVIELCYASGRTASPNGPCQSGRVTAD